METRNELRPLDDTKADHEQHNDTLSEDAPNKDSMKRKASINADELSSKRTKHDDYFREAPSEPRKRNSSPNRHNSYGNSPDIDVDRRKNATQEEKRRGKRLFGGLLSTLSQTGGSVQQKRRLEIERRQQDRLQKQNIEEDRLREEKRLRLTEIRRGEQLTFDEEVMHSKHTKMLAMARYLRTKSRPHIYYLPWKLTAEQEDTIDDQIQQTKVTIEREVESLNARKGRQAKGGRQPSETTAPSRQELDHDSKDTNGPEKSPHGQEKPLQASNHDHHHDESADVLEEADEDMTDSVPCSLELTALLINLRSQSLQVIGTFFVRIQLNKAPTSHLHKKTAQRKRDVTLFIMAPDKLVPNDSRVKTETAQIRGKNYKYIVGEPEGTPLETIVLIHGFPDLGFGWRYQVPYLMSLGFRVIVPDMVGYGGTDAPESLEEYTYKSLSADINELARKYVGEDGQIILGGHDWGGAIVWKAACWYPQLIKGVFSVCTPYMQPRETFVPLEAIIQSGHLLNFSYQLQFKGPEVQSRLQGEEKIRQFLNALYGGRTPSGDLGFSAKDGIYFDKLPELGPSPLVSKEEMDYYAKEYASKEPPELRGPLNYYRMQELNHRDDAEVAKKGGHKFEMPALFITATDDSALPPSMSKGMDSAFTNLTREEVKASHWALWQASEAVNQHITKWLDVVLDGALKAKASL
ncbi:hypothetical protein ACKLNR_000395 [Fusarium oxysporum f. sp. zingiberi]